MLAAARSEITHGVPSRGCKIAVRDTRGICGRRKVSKYFGFQGVGVRSFFLFGCGSKHVSSKRCVTGFSRLSLSNCAKVHPEKLCIAGILFSASRIVLGQVRTCAVLKRCSGTVSGLLICLSIGCKICPSYNHSACARADDRGCRVCAPFCKVDVGRLTLIGVLLNFEERRFLRRNLE